MLSDNFGIRGMGLGRRGGDGAGAGAAAAALGSEVGPTEDAVLALLELLVEPLLPSRSSFATEKPPSPAQEASVAKQVQAVVLLYDYYHRKHNPELEFLDFSSFCKLAVIFKPSLLRYMKFMQKADYTELVDLEKELSLVEKMIIEACDVCKGLDTSEDVVAEWPISKVAVFLVDYRKENCFLLQSANTMGVWSVIEKENSLGLEAEEKTGTTKKRIIRKSLKQKRGLDETGLQQLAFAAVKDACGCGQSDLKLLESHTVYSLSKEKTAARFYIIQCIESKNECNYIPIRDVINSLQGPLVRKEAHRWSATSVVEYFHVLPYADIIANWFSRKELLVTLHEAGLGVQNHEEAPTDAVREDNDRMQFQDISVLNRLETPFEMLRVKKNHNRRTDSNVPEQIDAGQKIDICENITFIDTAEDKESEKQNREAILNPFQLGSKRPCGAKPVLTAVYKRRNKSQNRCSQCKNSGCQQSKAVTECCKPEDKEHAVSNLPNDTEVDGHVSAVACSFNVESRSCSGEDRVAHKINRLPSLMINADKGNLLSQTALKVIHGKREILFHQLRNIQDEIALCDRNIQTILTGGADGLAVTLDSIIEGCSDVNLSDYVSAHRSAYKQVHDQNSSEYLESKRICEANLSAQNPCQELDRMCHKNA